MKEQNIGEILYLLREENHIEKDELCFGVCNKGTYYRYESGERVPDRLLLNVLLQRMGKNPEKLSTILTMEEYQYFLWKKKVLTAVGRENIGRVEELLREPEAVEIVVNQNLQKQFVYQMQAMVEMYTGKDINKCIIWLEQAVEMTMPGMQGQELEERALGTEEVMILLQLGQALIQGERKRRL